MSETRAVLTVKEMASFLGISIPSAYALVNRADFPSVRLSERRIVVPRQSLEQWLAEQARK